MGDQTGISWTDATWNPWMGCTRVSPGCDGCYMFREQRQYGNDPTIVRRSKTKFLEPLRWKEPKLVFTCSWSDFFHVDADPWRDEAWEVIRNTPQHRYQILTKRPGRIHRCLPADWGDGYPNVWLGVSIESAEFNHRADVLRSIPAALRFLSCEPLLGSLFTLAGGNGAQGEPATPGGAGYRRTPSRVPLDLDGIGWVIVGGESGPRKPSGDIPPARPMHPQWAREIRDAALELRSQERTAEPGEAPLPPIEGPLLHMKQWGSWTPDQWGSDSAAVWVREDGFTATAFEIDSRVLDMDGAVRMRYAGPHSYSGGKLLDGVDWCEIPDTGAGVLDVDLTPS